MLQQTQVARVLERWQPWLDRWPTVAALAADESDGAPRSGFVGAPDSGAQRQALDAAEFLGVLLPKMAQFHEQR